jgi:uncharacterized protein
VAHGPAGGGRAGVLRSSPSAWSVDAGAGTAEHVLMKYVLRYTAVEHFRPLAEANGAAHVTRLREFQDRGVLLLAGTLQEPMNGDALAIFTTREAAEEFVAGDPFVLNGVVSSWQIRPWYEVLQPDAG